MRAPPPGDGVRGRSANHLASLPQLLDRRARVKIGRTLLTAGVFALLAMIYVPTPHRGYRLIFSSDDTSIALFQLLVNVVFSALLGAILATIIPKIVRGAREMPLWA